MNRTISGGGPLAAFVREQFPEPSLKDATVIVGFSQSKLVGMARVQDASKVVFGTSSGARDQLVQGLVASGASSCAIVGFGREAITDVESLETIIAGQGIDVALKLAVDGERVGKVENSRIYHYAVVGQPDPKLSLATYAPVDFDPATSKQSPKAQLEYALDSLADLAEGKPFHNDAAAFTACLLTKPMYRDIILVKAMEYPELREGLRRLTDHSPEITRGDVGVVATTVDSVSGTLEDMRESWRKIENLPSQHNSDLRENMSVLISLNRHYASAGEAYKSTQTPLSKRLAFAETRWQQQRSHARATTIESTQTFTVAPPQTMIVK